MRRMMYVQIYDADGKEHRFGPVAVDIPLLDPAKFDHPGDMWATDQLAAWDFLKNDAGCLSVELYDAQAS